MKVVLPHKPPKKILSNSHFPQITGWELLPYKIRRITNKQENKETNKTKAKNLKHKYLIFPSGFMKRFLKIWWLNESYSEVQLRLVTFLEDIVWDSSSVRCVQEATNVEKKHSFCPERAGEALLWLKGSCLQSLK